MKKLFLLFSLLLIVLLVTSCNSNTTDNATKNSNGEITIYKSQGCGCCGLYSNYLKSKSKLDVNVINVDDISSIKRQYKVPSDLESCHTTVIGDYFIEGHIPIEAINKLIEEKPDIAGIAMPGMPSGSPGMPGAKTNNLIIYAVSRDGNQDVFMTL